MTDASTAPASQRPEPSPPGSPPPWACAPADVAAAVGVELATGLTADDAARRLAEDGPNELPAAPPPTWWMRLARQFADPLVALLLVAIAVSVVVWIVESEETVPVDAIVIALVVLANAAIGMWQEGKASDAVEALRRLTRPTATVLRNRHLLPIASADVVVGDILSIEEGDGIPADARVLTSNTLQVDESALTGESVPVAKSPESVAPETTLADRRSMLHSGTSVTRGHGMAVVVATGTDTEVGQIADLVGEVTSESTPLQRQIATLSRQLAVAVIAIAVLLIVTVTVLHGLESSSDLLDLLLAAIALAVAAVPEGLPAILAVVLALGVQRMAGHRAIVKRLVSVETLGSTTVICTDKTGTLTRNEMTVVAAATADGSAELTGVGFSPSGELVVAPEAPPGLADEVVELLRDGAAASNAHWEVDDNGDFDGVVGDPTEVALVIAHHKVEPDGGPRTNRLDEVPFDADRKMMSVLLEPADATPELAGDVTPDTTPVLRQVTKGAPEVILARCSTVRTLRPADGSQSTADEATAGSSENATLEERIQPLDDARRAAIATTIDGWATRGLRTLAIASKPHPRMPDSFDEQQETAMRLEGVVAIVDPLRQDAVDAVAAAQRAGIDVRMITGDHPETALAIASELSLPTPHATTGAELDAAVDTDRIQLLGTSSVFARVTPEHKLSIVRELRRRGWIVAMTGDGVNDAPALRSADIGVAMGRAGTDVARDAADMILTDDDFGTIVEAVREGRQIYENIRKFLRYLLATNAGEVVLMIVGVIAASVIGLSAVDEAALPLLATQILWINLVTDAAPALALGVDPPVDDVMERPPRPPDEPVIDAPMWSTIALIGIVTAVAGLVALDLGLQGGVLGGSGDIDQGRTMAFTTVVLAQVFNAFNARSATTSLFVNPFGNRLLVVSVAVAVVAQIAVVHFAPLNAAFSTTPLSVTDWLVCTALSSSVVFASEGQKLVRRRRAHHVEGRQH